MQKQQTEHNAPVLEALSVDSSLFRHPQSCCCARILCELFHFSFLFITMYACFHDLPECCMNRRRRCSRREHFLCILFQYEVVFFVRYAVGFPSSPRGQFRLINIFRFDGRIFLAFHHSPETTRRKRFLSAAFSLMLFGVKRVSNMCSISLSLVDFSFLFLSEKKRRRPRSE